MVHSGFIVIGASDIFELTTLVLADSNQPIIGYIGPEENTHSLYPDYSYLGDDDVIGSSIDEGCRYVLSLSNNARRLKLFEIISSQEREVMSLVHPSAVISSSAQIGPGATVLAGAIISTRARLGTSVFVNYAALVGHDVSVGDGAFIAPGARLLGEAEIGVRTQIGTNAVILPQVKVGSDAKISAGAVVTRDVPNGAAVMVQQKTRILEL